MKLTRKSFTTTDKNGCQFDVEAYYSTEEVFNAESRGFDKITESDYYAFGLHTNSLTELKKQVSEL